ncbi:DUF6178 family protein [Dissulfurimicrobium hydrothermale]|uniref:DUF6178 family protein n=1 Tax=Dissulfurimicrobium hydrothermale TaxID=1750598 RepID=UPI001EDB2CEF|nr:DUF6178 family protein [Dissulfurimicrobium hydrothermale]UKL14285.1 DUF6178 family protein [Dissulfurimicrobium hydrothermale]
MNYLPLEPLRLLEMPVDKAEALFNRLPLKDQATMVLGVPWERRQDLILMSKNARDLVRGMPAEELFWTIKAVGPQDALQIVDMAAPSQLQFIFDFDWWRKDNLVPEKIIAWLILLFEAGEETPGAWIRWISKQDETLLPLILRRFVQIQKRSDDLDLQEARDVLPAFTLDDVYFIAFKRDELAPLMSRFLNEIIAGSEGLYRDVMETILWETDAEGLETAFRLRNARLSDLGILDYYSSLDIYAPITQDQVRKIDDVGCDILGSNAEEDLMPAFIPTLYMGDYPALREAVMGIAGSQAMERIIFEWVGAANKILMAENVDLDDLEAQRKTLLSVAAALNLAIELLAAGEKGAHPVDILRECVLEDLVRLANTKIRALRSRVRRMMDEGLISREFLHLPDSWEYLLEGLVVTPRPRFWDPDVGDYVDFQGIAQVKQAEDRLNEIETWGLLMARIEPHWGVWRDTLSFKHTNFRQFRELTWQQALLTALANKALGGELVIRPVRGKDLMRLRDIWFGSGWKGEGAVPSGAVVIEEAMSAVRPLAVKSGVEIDTLHRMIVGMLNGFYDEIKGLVPDAEIDGRFIAAVWTEIGPDAGDQ